MLSEERVAENEARFRAINEEIASEADGSDASAASRVGFLCECADLACRSIVSLSLDEYTAVRAHPAQFVVRPGHERIEFERVIARARRYLVVEKVGDAGEHAVALE